MYDRFYEEEEDVYRRNRWKKIYRNLNFSL